MFNTLQKTILACTVFICALIMLPVITEASEVKGDYTVSNDGSSTSVKGIHGTEFLNFECTKTYANGYTRKDKFKYYLKTNTSYYDIPGLTNTNVLGTNCKTMVPQGMCKMNDLVLISAYDSEGKANSVIYVLNSDGLLATMVLPFRSHVGGLIYDGTNVWIVNGETDYKDNKTVSSDKKRVYYFTNKQVNGAVYYCHASVYKSAQINIKNQYKVLDIDAAYCTYYENKLWFGTFNSEETGMVYAYDIEYNSNNRPTLTKVGDLEAPRATQGMAFYRFSGKTYLIFSTSYGRNEDRKNFTNKLIVYKPTDYDSLNSKTGYKDYHKGARLKDITIPYMSENLCMKGMLMYIVFESGAEKYWENKNDRVPEKDICDKYCELDFYKVAIE